MVSQSTMNRLVQNSLTDLLKMHALLNLININAYTYMLLMVKQNFLNFLRATFEMNSVFYEFHIFIIKSWN